MPKTYFSGMSKLTCDQLITQKNDQILICRVRVIGNNNMVTFNVLLQAWMTRTLAGSGAAPPWTYPGNGQVGGQKGKKPKPPS